ncbi:MAG: thioredoxin-disulfide reductase [Lentisphaerae bacterium]|nr:thioredoxin-disulfide reductase [Lentisphaerota bacterium]
MEKLVIIGNGPAGSTAAIYAARAGLKPVVFAGSLPGGLLTQTGDVENFPGFPDGVNGFDLVMDMQFQAEKFGALYEYEEITSLQLSATGPHKLMVSDGRMIETDALIIASGATPRKLDVPGEERLFGNGVSACATCDGAFYKDVPVAVAGGGDSAMEEALFLTRFASEVHLIHRRDELRASLIMAERAKNHPKIKFHLNCLITEIIGDQKVSGVRILDRAFDKESVLPCSAIFTALGHVPCSKIFKDAGVETDVSGFIVVKPNTTLTNIPGVFAAGDCADSRYRQAIIAAGMGAKAAMDAEKYLADANK